MADADGDNVVDVCVRGPADAAAVWVLCDRANMVTASGMQCLPGKEPWDYNNDATPVPVVRPPRLRHP